MAIIKSDDLEREIIAGLAVFFSMAYVAFANPAILGPVGMAPGPVFYATCLVAALASFISGYYAGTAAALASGLALSSALNAFLSFPQTTITWESALVVCFIAGLLLLLISLSGYRRRILDAIPPVIKLAVIGGIGAILAETALDIVARHSNSMNYNIGLFAIGLLVITIGYIVVRSLSLNSQTSSMAGIFDAIGRASFFISVIVVAIAAHLTGGSELAAVPSSASWLWLETTKSFAEIVQGAFRWESISLLIFIFYILLADIVGSPYHLAHDDDNFQKPLNADVGQERTIRRSFYVDSLMNLLAPVAGTSPVVYYAENLAGKILGGRGPVVAYVPAAGFLILFLIGLILAQLGRPITFLIPGIAVAPVLFFIGLLIISKALWASSTREDQLGDFKGQSQPVAPLAEEFLSLGRRLPAALSIVVTPVAGFEVGVAFGILTYYLFYLILPSRGARQQEWSDGPLNVLALLAMVALFIKLKLVFGW